RAPRTPAPTRRASNVSAPQRSADDDARARTVQVLPRGCRIARRRDVYVPHSGRPATKGEHVLGRWGLGVLAVAATAFVLVAGAGAVTKPAAPQRVDVTTAAGLAKYLGTLPIKDWTRIVVQTGQRNYAGPSCPGVGWTCTTAKHVLQYGPKNQFQCSA